LLLPFFFFFPLCSSSFLRAATFGVRWTISISISRVPICKKEKKKERGKKARVYLLRLSWRRRGRLFKRARARAMRICDQRSSHFSVISDSIRHPLIRAFSPSQSRSDKRSDSSGSRDSVAMFGDTRGCLSSARVSVRIRTNKRRIKRTGRRPLKRIPMHARLKDRFRDLP